MSNLTCIVACVLALLGACVPSGDEPLRETDQTVTSLNGISLNGISLNGISLNGISLNGISLNGISLNGTSVSGAPISAGTTTTSGTPTTTTTTTTTTTASGPPLSGSAIVGSTWTGTATNGATVALRIDGAVVGTPPNGDLWFYAVSYQTNAGWSPLCGLDSAGLPVLAVSVAGVWTATASDLAAYSSSSTKFTLSCRAKTIAKCVELGYKTFKGYTTQLTTCVRLLRGDFCGTGQPYTVDGTLLNLYDNVGVQADTEAWAPEAEWTPSGARCVNSNNSARYLLALSKDPKCVRPIKTTSCGTSSFANGAILIDELP